MNVLGWQMLSHSTLLGFLPSLGPGEMMIVGLLAVLLFGKRLPEVGRSLGKGLVEFKKGMRGVEEELSSVRRTIDTSARASSYSAKPLSSSYSAADDRDEPTAPKFEPPTAAPQAETPAEASNQV